jgi:hypothetical protein
VAVVVSSEPEPPHPAVNPAAAAASTAAAENHRIDDPLIACN